MDEKVKRCPAGSNFVPCDPPYFKDADGYTPELSAVAKEIQAALQGVDPLMREQPKCSLFDHPIYISHNHKSPTV